MSEEMDALGKIGTCELARLLKGKMVVGFRLENQTLTVTPNLSNQSKKQAESTHFLTCNHKPNENNTSIFGITQY